MSPRKHWRPGDRFLVRHRDDDIVVVEKKAGLLSVAAAGSEEDLLGLLRSFLGGPRRAAPLWPVHRLDRHVSGLLVFARSQAARQRLIDQFRIHDVERVYVACVRGILSEDSGTFRSHLLSDPRTLKVYSSEEDAEDDGSQLAITHWRVAKRFERADATMVEVKLETGRRNQIRVHFAEAGHPLLGERKYVEGRALEASKRQHRTPRIFLHAAVLGFIHPTRGTPMRFEAPLPPELAAWARSLSSGGRPSEASPRGAGHPAKRRPGPRSKGTARRKR